MYSVTLDLTRALGLYVRTTVAACRKVPLFAASYSLFFIWFSVFFGVFSGTFLIDHISLIVLPYFITYWIFNPSGLNQWWGKKAYVENRAFFRTTKPYLYAFELLTAPLTLLMMWSLGMLPYFEIWIFRDPEAIKWFYLSAPKVIAHIGVILGIPGFTGATTDIIGISGSDFMWNGFLVAFGNLRVVPVGMLPTHETHWLFTVYAFVYWVSFVPVFALAVLAGRRDAFVKCCRKNAKAYISKRRRLVLLIGTFALLFDIAMAVLIVRLVASVT